ncbi:MAG: FkbM family methyltransferase [Acidobacteria bacterium]|nr:FkbM family methyltransferase [Acidobacteriota bacterium]
MMGRRLASWVPRALQSAEARAHARWIDRCAAADAADREASPFVFPHPLVRSFVYHPGDYLSRRIFLHDDFERAELRFAIEWARDGGTILDVGANIGLYTAACAQAPGAPRRVIAIEPAPETFARLRLTCERLGLRDVVLANVAAGARRGISRLICEPHRRDVHHHLADARAGGPGQGLPVETMPLDELCGDPAVVALVKIDVEGHEPEVLAGAPRILANGRARLIVEVFPAGLQAAGASPDDLWTHLQATHECVGVLASDGTERRAVRESLDAGGPEAVVNTLWTPRTA